MQIYRISADFQRNRQMFRGTQHKPRLSRGGPFRRWLEDFHSRPGLLQHDRDRAGSGRPRRRRQKSQDTGNAIKDLPEQYYVPRSVRQARFGGDTLRVRRRGAEFGDGRRYAVLHERRLVSVKRGLFVAEIIIFAIENKFFDR